MLRRHLLMLRLVAAGACRVPCAAGRTQHAAAGCRCQLAAPSLQKGGGLCAVRIPTAAASAEEGQHKGRMFTITSMQLQATHTW